MRQAHGLKRTIMVGAVACLNACLAANAQSMPAGSGKADVQRICSGCHSVERVTSQRMTRTEWAAVVNDMVSRGAQGSSAELDNIVSYLATNFGKENAPPSPGTPTPPVATLPSMAAVGAPLSEEEMSKAKRLIQESGCLSCHRMGETGSYIGPNLDGVGARRSPEQIHDSLVSPKKELLPENRTLRLITGDGKVVEGRLLNQDGFSVQLIDSSGQLGARRSPEQIHDSLVSPKKELLPENRTLRLITGDGKVVEGRLLNQDGFSVQLIDSSGQLRSFEKSGLRECTIVTTNPMPSYAGKLSAQNLADLLRYLSSLKSSSTQ